MDNDLFSNKFKNSIRFFSVSELYTSEITSLNLKNEFAIVCNNSTSIKINFNNKDYEIIKNSITLISDIVQVDIDSIYDTKILIINKDFLYANKLEKIISYYNILFYSKTYLTSFQMSESKIEDKHFKNSWDLLDFFVNKNTEKCELLIQNLLDYIFFLCLTKVNNIDHTKLNDEFNVEVLRKFHILLEENFKEVTDVKSYANLLCITPKTLYNISKVCTRASTSCEI